MTDHQDQDNNNKDDDEEIEPKFQYPLNTKQIAVDSIEKKRKAKEKAKENRG